MKRGIGIIAVVILIVIAFCWPVGSTLLLGWSGFLSRTLPRLNPDGPTVLAALAAFGLFTAGVHWLGRSWARHRDPAATWPLERSLAATAMLLVLFTAAVAMVGIVHMSSWLATSPERIEVPVGYRLVVGRMKSSNNLKQIGHALHNFDSRNSSLPGAATFDSSGQMLHGWETHLLPYLEVDARGIDMTVPWDHLSNAKYHRIRVNQFQNPLFDLPSMRIADFH